MARISNLENHDDSFPTELKTEANTITLSVTHVKSIVHALVHWRKTVPGLNRSTSVSSVLKRNLMLPLLCDKITLRRQAVAPVNILYNCNSNLCATSAKTMWTTNQLGSVSLLQLCYIFKHSFDSISWQSWQLPRDRTETVTDCHPFTNQHANIPLIINLPCFDRDSQTDGHIHSDAHGHIDAHIVCFTCAIFCLFSSS